MKKKNIPDSYFEEQEFVVTDLDEELIVGVLGKNPSTDQLLKYELCDYIARIINGKQLSLVEVEELTGTNSSDVSRIKNYHLDRFTIDRLMRISTALDNQYGVALVLERTSKIIRKMSA